MSLLGLVALLGVILFVALFFSTPLLIFLFGFGFFEKKHRYKIKDLAEANAWQYDGGLGTQISGVDAGTPWHLQEAGSNRANSVWQTTVPTADAHIWIMAKRSGAVPLTLSSKMKRFTLGSSAFQKRYHVRASDQALVTQMLTPSVEQLLLDWPKHPLQADETSISVKNGRLHIVARINYNPDRITQLVSLGLAVKQALTAAVEGGGLRLEV